MKVSMPDFCQSHVLVAGDVMLDRYWYGPTNRISPEAPVPIVKIDKIEERPGGAANIAMNIAALGAKSRLVGLTGIDNAAHVLFTHLKKMNVICDFIAVAKYSTTTKLRVLSQNQQLIRLDFERKIDKFDSTKMLKYIQSALPNYGVLVLSDYAKGALSNIVEIIRLARTASIPVLVDPKGTDFSRYRGATLLTPNLLEFEAVVGHCKNESELISKGMKVIINYNLSALLITRSEQGMTLLELGKKPIHLPTQAQEVYDATGAGDTVIGVLAASLLPSKNLEEACFLANAAAGVVVGKIGTSTVSPIELENAIRGRANTGFGIMTEEGLKKSIALSRKRGEKIIMTNGVFDILHAGHISYLSNARRLGDRLIVAVNSDASTKRLKGEKRPVNKLAQRMIVLAALESVDWVVSFKEDTPKRLIAEVLPDVLVKGGDYQNNKIIGGQEVLANNGGVQTVSFENGFSTTKIINAIKNSKKNI